MSKRSVALIITPVMLLMAGCADTEQIVSQQSDIETSESADEVDNSNKVSIRGVCGEEISATDYSVELEDTDFDFSIYTYEGFGYYSPSDGAVVCKYDCEPFGEIDEPEMSSVDYQHIDIGDEILGLKLERAKGMLYDKDGVISLEQQELRFSGSIELDGYVYICRGDELYCDENQILFLPADGEWNGLPYHYMQGDPRYLGENYDFYWNGKAYVLSLGNLSDYDFSELDKGGHSVREATVTISDLIICDCFTDMFFGAESYVRSATLDSIDFK